MLNFPNNRIDYVLVYEINLAFENDRNICERNLKEMQLEMEKSNSKKNIFIKIHAPNKILKKYCEILKMKMPVKDEIVKQLQKATNQGKVSKFKVFIGSILYFFCIDISWRNQNNLKITADYNQNRSFLFDDNNEDFFSTSDRCMIVNFILEKCINLTDKIEKGIYKTAYPPHQGAMHNKNKERGKLFNYWGKYRTIFFNQPIDDIKDYFGIKFALHFAWVGFYTYMLVPASIAGFISFVYSYHTSDQDTLSNEICDTNNTILMCPQCDNHCDYWNITDACSHYRVRYYCDNYGTYIFGFIISIWSALYLKLWKRYSAETTDRWGLKGFSLHEEQSRRDYKKSPCWAIKIPFIIINYAIIFFLLILVSGAIFSLVLYNMYLATSDYLYGTGTNKYKKTFLVPITTAILNAILVHVLSAIYNKLAICLTKHEFQRTQMQFENSLHLKMFLFEFVNYYSPIIYIAFLKGRFIGYPGKYNRIFGYRQEECEPGGCLLEVSIQVTIFMLLEQFITNMIAYLTPRLFGRKCLWNNLTKLGYYEKEPRWLQDLHLNSWNNTEISQEYLNIVIQYGFITIFATSLPLAPICALLMNFFIEMKLGAKKFILYYKRPVAQRASNIGIWYYIIKLISKFSIFTNACIIAFSSNLVPMLYYKYTHGYENRTYNGFLKFQLSYFNFSTSHLDHEVKVSKNVSEYDGCYYTDYRDDNNNRTLEFWYIIVCQLIFIIVYQNIVTLIVTIIEFIIPDVPKKVELKSIIENRILSEILLKHSEDTRK